jgi:hypothetical protein
MRALLWQEIKLPNMAEPPPTRDMNRDSGTDRDNGVCLFPADHQGLNFSF